MAYIGELRLFAGNYAPNGWAFCDGQLVQIAENDALFTLIGTTYGGDGQSTFALPDLRGRVPVHHGQGPGLGLYVIGQSAGVESVTLTTTQLPVHTHGVPVSTTTAGSTSARGGVPAALPADVAWDAGPATEPVAVTTAAGGSQPHENRQPYLGINYIISLYGIYPTQS